ncbi:hypothetical protein DKX38_026388 [Salix brachista]|uniref:Serine/threonine-protein kinase RIO2 n=1 Tax=Salix brachista TaxID=2182728 RepID=A0A5N5JDJ0_9ROSI|nr:hypothetical protein DKX38_026388 [Salix brachista]
MKLDVEALRYLSKDDFRVLTAVEMGMRNHEIVPAELIDRIASLKHGGTYKVLKNLLKHKLLHHDSSKYDGFRLTYLGYDFLAIKTLVNRGVISSVGRKLGTGKESDIYEVAAEDGTVLAMKLHRLGRVSFRAVKTKRDYLRHRSSFNWLYLSRLAALKEFAFMKALEEHEFPVPKAVDCNRHCVIMSLVQGYPLVQVKELQNPETIFETVLGVIVRLAEHGLIHCDFNEFNIMIDDDEKVTVIDFPQMVSVSHRNAQMYFDRDVECIFKFFQKRFNLSFQVNTDDNEDSDADTDETGWPSFSSISKSSGFLDRELAASGFPRKDQEDIEKFIEEETDDTDSGREETEDKQFVESMEANVKGLSSFHLEEQSTLIEEHIALSVGIERGTLSCLLGSCNDSFGYGVLILGVEVKQRSCKAGQDNGPEIEDDSDKAIWKCTIHRKVVLVGLYALVAMLFALLYNMISLGIYPTFLCAKLSNFIFQEEDNQSAIENDAELNKSLNKQRKRAVAAARGGRRSYASRNSYKDKAKLVTVTERMDEAIDSRDREVRSLHFLAEANEFKLKQIHAFSIRHGIPVTNSDMGKHLIYTSVSLSVPMNYAHNIFTQIQSPNVFTWNTMIRGYAESENPKPAIELYHHMQLKPDTHTYPFLLKAVSKVVDVKVGEKIHSLVAKNGFESLLFVQNSLLHMYAACGQFESAYKVFELMPEKDIVAWNSVINGFALNGKPNEVLTLYKRMGSEGVEPDGFTMVSLLSACADLATLALGRRAHVYMVKVGLNKNLHANNALLDLYAKCGTISEARNIFDEIGIERNVVSWTSLIVGLAVNGFGEEALEHFKDMEREGLVPSEITFVGVLYACSHCGIVNEGFEYFMRMKEQYDIVPRIEHYGCMVDLLGRAGLLKEAYNYIQDMPLQPNDVVWRTLLGACTIHGHLGLGAFARARLVQLEPKDSGDYVLFSNLYASEQRWSDVHEVRRTMLSEGVRKTPGYSLVELGNHVHEFVMGDRTHPQSEAIYKMLVEIAMKLKLAGYVPHTANVLADIEEEEKESALFYHSEKIAIAFMLINTIPGTPIRIIKNLRVCTDCHFAIKLISKVFERYVVVRDCSRFHHFRDGSCSSLILVALKLAEFLAGYLHCSCHAVVIDAASSKFIMSSSKRVYRDSKYKGGYLRHLPSCDWIYLSTFATLKDFASIKALKEHRFPVPKAVDCNRHCVITSLVQEHGLIHCDFNEFNYYSMHLIDDDEEKVPVVDFLDGFCISLKCTNALNNSLLHYHVILHISSPYRFIECSLDSVKSYIGYLNSIP